MTNMALSAGSISALWTKSPPAHLKPVVQILSVVATMVKSVEKFKIQISDGSSFMNGILGNQLNEMVKKNELRTNSIVRLTEFIINEYNNVPVVIVLQLEILENPLNKIGNPVDAMDSRGGNPISTNSNRVLAPPAIQSRPVPVAPAQFAQQTPQTVQYNSMPVSNSYQPQYGQGSIAQVSKPVQPSYNAPAQPTYAQTKTVYAPVAPLQSMISGGPGNKGMPRTIPIKMLNPYQNKWTIRARVTAKSTIRTWDKGPTNQGKLFSVDLLDQEGGEIRATFFREAVDAFYDSLNVGGVFLFSEGKVKIANRQFSAVRNEYEISFGKEAVIQPAKDDGEIVAINIAPIAINDLNAVENKGNVDIVAIATEVTEAASFTSKAGKELRKMEVTLVDKSNASVRLTIWGDKADELTTQLRMSEPNPVLAIKNAQVSEYGGRSLSSISSSTILVNPPQIPQAGQLRSWFDAGNGRDVASKMTSGGAGGEARGAAPIQSRYTLESIKSQGLGMGGQQDFVDAKAYLMFFRKDNLWYPACPTKECKGKKVTKSPADDQWFCERCNQQFAEPEYRYIAAVNIADPTGSSWATIYNEAAGPLFGGLTASNLERIKRDNESQFNEIIQQNTFKEGLFRLKVKEEQYQQQLSVKYTVMNFRPINYSSESRELLKALDQYETM